MLEIVDQWRPFSHPVTKFKVLDTQLLKDLRYLVLGLDKEVEDLTDTGWDKFNLLDIDRPEVRKLEELFIEASSMYTRAPGSDIHLHCWANVRSGRGMHCAHTHGNTSLVLNLYLSAPPNSALEIFNPQDCTRYIPWAANDIGQQDQSIQVEKGDLVVIPGWYYHQVPPTLNEVDSRISISCNVLQDNMQFENPSKLRKVKST
jgi:hypothetical protein